MDGNVRTYQYDSAGHVISETLYATAADAAAGQNAEDTLHYAYDKSGNLTSESDDSSSDTLYLRQPEPPHQRHRDRAWTLRPSF